jgi:hypothetical protein
VEAAMTETLVVLLCVALCAGIGVSPLASVISCDPQGARGRAMRRAEVQFAAAVMLAATCGLLSLWLFARSGQPWWPMLIMLAVCLPLVHPWSIVRGLFIPLGMARTAYRVARLGGHPWFRDPNGGAVLCGVLASLRRRKHSPALCGWLRARLDDDTIGGAGLVALGLLAADAGDRVTARSVLGSLDEIEPDICPPVARAIALDWLVADAAGRGAWHELVDRVADDPFPTRTTRLVGVAARRMIGEDVSRMSVLWCWLRAPRRLRTLGLLWAAMRRSKTPAPAIADAELARLAANGAPEPILDALALHAEIAAQPQTAPVLPAVVERLAAAWDVAFGDFGLRGHVRDRAEVFAVQATGELLIARVQRAVARDLASLVAQCGRAAEGLRRDTGVLRRAREVHFEEVLERMVPSTTMLGRARDPKTGDALDPIGAWSLWVRVRSAYLAAVVPLDLGQRAIVYAGLELHVRQCAAWLWNERHERGLAHAMCLFLLGEAEKVKDAEAAAYYRHNVVVGL